MRTISLLLAFLLFSITFAEEAKKAPDFTLKNAEGKEVSLADFSGKIVVIEWYALWCTKCRDALSEVKPYFNTLHKEYADKDVVVIAINLDKKKPEKIKAFAEKKGMEYMLLLDPKGITGKSYSLKTLPLIIIVGKDGTIVKKFQGFKKGKTIKLIKETIASLTSQSKQ
jgi:peroxiredoxin